MDPDKTLEIARAMVVTWEEAGNADAEHAAARELSSAFGALDEFLSHGGRPPREWSGGLIVEGSPAATARESVSVLDMVREFVVASERAMTAEGVDPMKRTSVTNRLMWGHPDGAAGIQREAEQIRTAQVHNPVSDQGAGSTIWHMLTGNPVTPELTHPVFGKDFRETDASTIDDESVHPLLATCVCGEQISRIAPGEPWEHDDPRV
jgi:hypothetical protein